MILFLILFLTNIAFAADSDKVKARLTAPGTQRSGAAKIVLDRGERATIDPLVIPKGAKLIVRAQLAEKFRTAFPDARLATITLRSRKGAPEVKRDARVEGTDDIVFGDLRPGPYEMIAIVSIPESTQPIEVAMIELSAGEERRYDANIDPLVFRGRVTSGGTGVAMQLSIWGDLGGRPALSKPTGEFAILLPKRGTYAVQGYSGKQPGRAIEFGSIAFDDPRQPVELRVPQGVAEVVVTDGGKPAAGATVFAQLQLDGTFYSGPAGRVTLDDSGTARFPSLFEGRTWLFEARGENGRIAEKAIVVRGDTPLRIALELQDPVLVGGTIRDHNGAPMKDARVSCIYLNADDHPRLAGSQPEADGRYAVKLASAPSSKVRCGVRGATIGTFATAPSRTADYTLPPPEKTGTLVIKNWRHTVRTRNTLWLTNAAGDVFNLDWVGGGAGPAPAPLTIGGVPAGRWKIVRVKSLPNLGALARGTMVGLQDVETITIKAGEKTEIALEAFD